MVSIKRFICNKKQQILSTIIAALSIMTDAMQIGWSSPATPKLKRFDSPIKNFNEDAANRIEDIYLLGGLIGLPLTVFLVDKFGRKTSIIVASCTNLTSWTLIALAGDIVVLYVSRFIGGVSSAINFIAVSIYIAEIADKKVRGFLSSFSTFSGVIGVLVIYSVAPFVPIRTSAFIAASVNVFQLFAFTFIPESPYFLLKKRKYDEGKRALRFLRCNRPDIDDDYEEIKCAIERQEGENGRYVDLFLNKGNRKATIIGCVLYVAEHFGCVTIILMNLQTILEEANGSIPADIASILFAVVTLFSSLIGMYVIDKIGRKKLLVASIVTTSFFLSTIATYFLLKDYEFNLRNYSWVPIVCIICYGICVKGGLEMVPIIIIAELFPTRIKAKGLTFADIVYVSMSLLTLNLYHVFRNHFGIYCAFYIYAFILSLISVFVVFYVPETSGKTLEQIQIELHKIKPAKLQSNNHHQNNKTSIQVIES